MIRFFEENFNMFDLIFYNQIKFILCDMNEKYILSRKRFDFTSSREAIFEISSLVNNTPMYIYICLFEEYFKTSIMN